MLGRHHTYKELSVTEKKQKKKISLSPAAREIVERLADLEGVTPSQMMVKMAQFYEQAVDFLHKEGLTPEAFNVFVLNYRRVVIERGMEHLGKTLRGEDMATQRPPVQNLGKRKFSMPGPGTVVRADDDYSPEPPAPPTPAQREVG